MQPEKEGDTKFVQRHYCCCTELPAIVAILACLVQSTMSDPQQGSPIDVMVLRFSARTKCFARLVYA